MTFEIPERARAELAALETAPDRAEEERDDGMARALRAERVQQWKQNAELWLDRQNPGREFTADQLVEVVGLPDEGVAKNNVVGAWFSQQSRAGRIEFAGRFAKSERVIGHGNLQRVWRVARAMREVA